jgi:hypothetical protein
MKFEPPDVLVITHIFSTVEIALLLGAKNAWSPGFLGAESPLCDSPA